MDFYKENILRLGNSDKEYKMIMKIERGDNSFQILLNGLNNPMTENYYIKITLEEFRQLNKFFRMFDTIKECAESLGNIMRDSNPKLLIQDNKALISINIFIPGNSQQSIEFTLEKNSNELDNIVNNLLKEINILKSKVNDLNLLINEKDKKINEISEKNEALNKKLESLEEKHKLDFMNLKSWIFPFSDDTIIINDQKQLQFLSNKFRLIRPDKNVKFFLLYRKSRDSAQSMSFHFKCDYMKGTLVLIKTEDNLIFGGYTNETWSGYNLSKKDDTAFVFSLTNLKACNVKSGFDAIFCSPSYGPYFQGGFVLYDYFDSKGGECFKSADSNYDGLIQDYELNNGKKNFKVKEIEVFRVDFENIV